MGGVIKSFDWTRGKLMDRSVQRALGDRKSVAQRTLKTRSVVCGQF